MKLQSEYETMSDVPAGFEGAYADNDGRAVFVGGEFEFKTGSEYEELLAKKQDGFRQYHEVKEHLKKFDGVDIERYKQVLNENDVLKQQAKEGNLSEEQIAQLVKTRVDRETEDFSRQISELTEANKELMGFREKTQRDAIVGKLLSEHVGQDAIMDAEIIINAAISRQADGTYASNGQFGFDEGIPVEKLVPIAVEGRPLWKKQSTSGHGAQGSSGAGEVNKVAQFNALVDKVRGGEATPREERKMKELSREIQRER